MTPRFPPWFLCVILGVVLIGLALLFKPVLAFVELAAVELRYFWWLILLLALAGWLIWGIGRKPKE